MKNIANVTLFVFVSFVIGCGVHTGKDSSDSGIATQDGSSTETSADSQSGADGVGCVYSPSIVELCNGKDDNCNGIVDEGCVGDGGTATDTTPTPDAAPDATVCATGTLDVCYSGLCKGSRECIANVWGSCRDLVCPGPDAGTPDTATCTASATRACYDIIACPGIAGTQVCYGSGWSPCAGTCPVDAGVVDAGPDTPAFTVGNVSVTPDPVTATVPATFTVNTSAGAVVSSCRLLLDGTDVGVMTLNVVSGSHERNYTYGASTMDMVHSATARCYDTGSKYATSTGSLNFHVLPSSVTTGVPVLSSPTDGALLDNGRTDGTDYAEWDFSVLPVTSAAEYHFEVRTAAGILVNDRYVTTTLVHVTNGWIDNSIRFGWKWKAQARVGSLWSAYSAERIFDVEPVNTDGSSGGGGSTTPNVDAQLMSGDSSRVRITLTGDVLGSLFDSSKGTPTRICLVGDSMGWDSRSYCQTYSASTSTTYTFDNISRTRVYAGAGGKNRLNYLAETAGGVRWMNDPVVTVSGYVENDSTDHIRLN